MTKNIDYFKKDQLLLRNAAFFAISLLFASREWFSRSLDFLAGFDAYFWRFILFHVIILNTF